MNDQLERELHRSALQYDVRPGDVSAVVRRAEQRTRRRSRVVVAASLLVVVALVSTIVRVADDPSTTVSSEGGQAVLGDSGIVWKRQAVSGALGEHRFTDTVAFGGTFYAVSTAPGLAPTRGEQVPSQLYRSGDGVSWEPAESPGEIYFNDLAVHGDQLYAVGTAPGSARTQQSPADAVVASRTADGWSTERLPIDTVSITAASKFSTTFPRGLAVSDAGVVTAVSVVAEPDVTRLIPGLDAPHGYAVTPHGIDVLGNANPCPAGVNPVPDARNERVHRILCDTGDGTRNPEEFDPESRGVVRQYDWQALGVDGDVLDAFLGKLFVFFAPTGSSTFERVARSLPASEGSLPYLRADDAGFTVLVPSYGSGRFQPTTALAAYRSADGRRWDADGGTEGIYVNQVGQLDGSLAGLGGDAHGTPFLLRSMSGTWQRTELSSLVDGKEGSFGAIGPLGVVLAVGTHDRHPWILSSRDGQTWTKTDVSDLVDEPFSHLTGLSIVGDRAVVTVALEEKDAQGFPKQVALVGTPR
jgi:hypothetical protein